MFEKEKYIFPTAKDRAHTNSDFWRNVLREERIFREIEDRKNSEKDSAKVSARERRNRGKA